MKIFNQWNAEWRDEPLGQSGLTMGNAGCYTTTSAMLLGLDPGELNAKLNDNYGYDIFGQLRWDVLRRLYPEFDMYRGVWTTTAQYPNVQKVQLETAIKTIRFAHALGQRMGICVDLVGNDGVPDHIVALKPEQTLAEDPGDWQIGDPDGGRDIRLKDRYGGKEAIRGYRLTVIPPTSFPEVSPEVAKEIVKNAGVSVWKALQIHRGRNIATYSREIVDSLL